jgi:CRP-like cAMP-binding protein
MVLSRQLAEAYAHMEDLERRDVGARLAHVLARFVTRTGQTVVEATHDELAGLAGTNREKVTKELQVLRAAELIEHTPRSRRIRVIDVERLAAL